jgi:diaminopimelate decarboxylase/aspartate kinase
MEGNWVVLKYGGTSVSTRSNWDTIAATVKKRHAEGLRPLVVCSAVTGISNALDRLCKESAAGHHEAILAEVFGRHEVLARDLGIDLRMACGDELAQLERLAHGISLIGTQSPALMARVMAFGEILSTKIGHSYFRKLGFVAAWHDARKLLTAQTPAEAQDAKKYLSAVCPFGRDYTLDEKLGASAIVLTQGFIASNESGETVLLGRGGSDTSASYFAAKLKARRLEIWTSVPGMFTANPHEIANARLLRRLDYDEAQELATSGAKVLHPQSISPVRVAGVPLHIAWTENPSMQGTVVDSGSQTGAPSVKAVSMKTGIQVISMDSIGMWQQAGFLADVFGCFKRYGLSIDLVATSETNVTISLDRGANVVDDTVLGSLLKDLKEYCSPKSFGPCASVSLVGKHIRAILHKLAPALEVFENKEIFMLSQSASDLNFSVVVEEKDASKLMSALHGQFFADPQDEKLFGPTWTEIAKSDQKNSEPHETKKLADPWWLRKRDQLLKMAISGTPLYVYDFETISERADELIGIRALDRLHYAVKANPHPEILKLLFSKGFHFDCVSQEELEHVLSVVPGITSERLLFTPNFAAAREYEFALGKKCVVTLDNVHPLEHHGSMFKGAQILVRVDSGIAKGHHPHVMTSGPKSKFGVSLDELDRIKVLANKHGATISGLHAHVGSGIMAPETWAEAARYLAAVAAQIDTVEILDIGGGLGVVERPGRPKLEIDGVSELLQGFKDEHSRYRLWMEPGRYLVAEAGVILSKVTQTKRKSGKYFVGLDVGMNSLIRPALYGAWHEIVNLTRFGDLTTLEAEIVGPICESGDVLGHNRAIPESFEDDVFLIGTAGAYGKSMASCYNLRKPAEDLVLR